MTRMWNVNPELLCDPAPNGNNHLQGEHAEIHKAYGGLINHQYGESIIEGQVEEGNIDTTMMKERHDQLAEEMERRGMNHNSPFEYEYHKHFGDGCIDKDQNLIDLTNRCNYCKERISNTKKEVAQK